MKILVTLKPVPDPEQPFRFTGGRFDFSQVGVITNPFDEYALETALRLTDVPDGDKTVRGEGEIVAVSIGEAAACVKVLKRALGLGANRVYHITVPQEELDFSRVARILEGICLGESPDLILMGKQAVDSDSGIVPPYLAGLLGVPQVTAATAITERPGKLLVERELEGGTEQKEVTLPAVVSVDLGIGAVDSVRTLAMDGTFPWAEGPRYPTIRGMLRTKNIPLESHDPEEFTKNHSRALAEGKQELSPPRKPGVIVENIEELAKVLGPFVRMGGR
ncbi:electron transfer flavoprotein subunit beta/FixA family protein [Myxococcota bacterium]|nr:electron transfer flavoprotein subunit beta/FixA family protein [Myxococcota bacterium]MBU1537825.1 electron transfer flavoprotein subunit beta/FixA family protein [Myxococcota bacterium]